MGNDERKRDYTIQTPEVRNRQQDSGFSEKEWQYYTSYDGKAVQNSGLHTKRHSPFHMTTLQKETDRAEHKM